MYICMYVSQTHTSSFSFNSYMSLFITNYNTSKQDSALQSHIYNISDSHWCPSSESKPTAVSLLINTLMTEIIWYLMKSQPLVKCHTKCSQYITSECLNLTHFYRLLYAQQNGRSVVWKGGESL